VNIGITVCIGRFWNTHWDNVPIGHLIPFTCLIQFIFARDLKDMPLSEEKTIHRGVTWII